MRMPILLILLCCSSLLGAEPRRAEVLEVRIPDTLVTFKLVRVPGGVVEVKLASGEMKRIELKPFWIGQTELAWEAYDIYVYGLDLTDEQRASGIAGQTRPSTPFVAADQGWGHVGFPALGIHSNGAKGFCEWLSQKTGQCYRLPTEAEWEYACRAGRADEPFADEADLLRQARVRENSEDDVGDRTTQAVASKPANAWGLHDMLGNVAEWAVGIDGEPVTKGGSFRDKASRVSSRLRAPFDPRWQWTDPEEPKSKWWLRDAPHVGFRIVREINGNDR